MLVLRRKKKTLPGSLQTVVRSGEAPPDGRFFKLWELAAFNYVLMNIHQNSIQMFVKQIYFPKVNKQFQRIGQIEAMA